MRAKAILTCSLATLALLICAASVGAQGGGISEDAWDSLISYWELGEISGVRYDAHGANDLTDNNTTGSTASGVIYNAADFVAANDEYLYHYDNASLSFAQDDSFSVSAWICSDFVTDTVWTLSKGAFHYGDLGNEWVIYRTTNTGFRFSISDGSTWSDVVFTQTLTAGTCYFVVASYDALSNRQSLSVNGSAYESVYRSYGTHDHNCPFVIGGGGEFDGVIDEVAIWGSALSDSDISALYNSGNGLAYPFGYDRPVCDSSLIEGLVSYWKLDEESGVRYDSWGSNHLSDNNTVLSTTGVIGNAADFVAANSEYLNHPDNDDLSFTSEDFSISAWVYIEDESSTRALIAKDKFGQNEWAIQFNQDENSLELLIRHNDSPTNYDTVRITSTQINEYVHVVAWVDYDGAGDSTIGIASGNNIAITTTQKYITNTNAPLWIGRTWLGGGQYLDGSIDEVGIWDRALTDAERAALYNSGAGAAFPWCGMMQPQGGTAHITYLPLVTNNYKYEPPDYDLGFDPIDYSGDTTWYDWAQQWAEATEPLLRAIADATTGARNIENDMCDVSPYLTGDGYKNVSPLTALGDNPSIREVAYALGWALGAPVAWVRGALSYANAFDAFWITALIYFVLAGLAWIAFVVVVFYGVRLVRALIDLALMIYDRIPFKAT